MSIDVCRQHEPEARQWERYAEMIEVTCDCVDMVNNSIELLEHRALYSTVLKEMVAERHEFEEVGSNLQA